MIWRKVLAVKTAVNWRKRMAARFRTVREGLPRPLIQFDETEVAFTAWHADGSASKTELAWNEVNGVVAYKRDCYTI